MVEKTETKKKVREILPGNKFGVSVRSSNSLFTVIHRFRKRRILYALQSSFDNDMLEYILVFITHTIHTYKYFMRLYNEMMGAVSVIEKVEAWKQPQDIESGEIFGVSFGGVDQHCTTVARWFRAQHV